MAVRADQCEPVSTKKAAKREPERARHLSCLHQANALCCSGILAKQTFEHFEDEFRNQCGSARDSKLT